MWVPHDRRLIEWSGHLTGSGLSRCANPCRTEPRKVRTHAIGERLSGLMKLIFGFSPSLRTDRQSEQARESRDPHGEQEMHGMTAQELVNLLDSGLTPNEISYLCFTRWRFRRGELNDGICITPQVTPVRGFARESRAAYGRLTA